MLQQQKNQWEYWKAYVYEQQETDAAALACMRRLIGDQPLRILEVGCGGAKWSAPLAKAGHDVTGIDRNGAMLYLAVRRARSLPNLHIRKADALAEPWGTNYDVIILGANLLCTLITEWDHKQAQKQLIQRSAAALRPGGKLIIDFDCPVSLAAYGAELEKKQCFEATDSHGTAGRHLVCGSVSSEKNRMLRTSCQTEIIPANGPAFQVVREHTRHFPTLAEVSAWLYREGFAIESLYGGYRNEPFDMLHRRAVIAARKE